MDSATQEPLHLQAPQQPDNVLQSPFTLDALLNAERVNHAGNSVSSTSEDASTTETQQTTEITAPEVDAAKYIAFRVALISHPCGQRFNSATDLYAIFRNQLAEKADEVQLAKDEIDRLKDGLARIKQLNDDLTDQAFLSDTRSLHSVATTQREKGDIANASASPNHLDVARNFKYAMPSRFDPVAESSALDLKQTLLHEYDWTKQTFEKIQVSRKFGLGAYEDFWPIRWMLRVYLQQSSIYYTGGSKVHAQKLAHDAGESLNLAVEDAGDTVSTGVHASNGTVGGGDVARGPRSACVVCGVERDFDRMSLAGWEDFPGSHRSPGLRPERAFVVGGGRGQQRWAWCGSRSWRRGSGSTGSVMKGMQEGEQVSGADFVSGPFRVMIESDRGIERRREARAQGFREQVMIESDRGIESEGSGVFGCIWFWQISASFDELGPASIWLTLVLAGFGSRLFTEWDLD
ncbi:hypothetical protein B0H11DRAFT_1914956 [Mycena galericulata]|nr:hypothetical protein B0H11DRAFT_1914956 [Mycena galericulata]